MGGVLRTAEMTAPWLVAGNVIFPQVALSGTTSAECKSTGFPNRWMIHGSSMNTRARPRMITSIGSNPPVPRHSKDSFDVSLLSLTMV